MPKPGYRLELVTPDGLRFDLHNPPTRSVTGLTGFGLSPRETSTVTVPYQHGKVPLSQRLEPRTVSFTFRWNGYSREQNWGHHETLVDYLRENRVSPLESKPHQLIMHTHNHTGLYIQRALDVFFEEGMTFAPSRGDAWDEWSVTEQVSFVAYNPLIYDPVQRVIGFQLFGEQLTLPALFPIVFGTYASTVGYGYIGTWETFPIFQVAGPATHVSFLHQQSGARINFAGTILGNEVITIDLREGEKSVTDDCGKDLFNYASGDFGTFSILPKPLIADGINTITAYVGGYDLQRTQVLMGLYIKYRGI